MRRLAILMLAVVLVLPAVASDVASLESLGITLPQPYGTDSAQQDTIMYDNGTPGLLTTGTNYWNAVRYTAPSSYMLKSVYLAVLNAGQTGGRNTTAPCSVFVYSDTLIAGVHRPQRAIANMSVVLPAPLQSVAWYDRDFPDSVQFAANSNFWVVYGPTPGGAYAGNGWWNLMDGNGNTENRSVINTGGRTSWTSMATAGGDMICRVGGHYGSYTDVRVDSIAVSNTSGRRFFHHQNEPLTITAAVKNTGNIPVNGLSLIVGIVDTVTADTMFRQEIVITSSLARNQVVNATSNSWTTPNRNFSGLAFARVVLTGDADPSNDMMMVEQKVNQLNTWYGYDDGTSEASVNFSSGRVGVMFIPSQYPARIDSMSFVLAGTGAPSNDTVEVYLVPDLSVTSLPLTPDWTGTIPVVSTAATRYTVATDTLHIFRGGVIAVYKAVQNHPVYRDNNLPLAGTNLSMPAVTWQSTATALEPDESGDWLIRAYLSPTDVRPNFAILRTMPAVGDTVRMDTTTVNQPITRTFTVFNDGGVPLVVNRMWVIPSSQAARFSLSDTAMTVPAGGSHVVNMTWTPISTGSLPNTSLYMNWNGTPTQLTWRITGYSRSVSVNENETTLPKSIELLSNRPNPFNPTTEIRFNLPARSAVRLTVLDVMGREVATLAQGDFVAGYHSVHFDGSKLASGVYFYRLEAGAYSSTRKMMLLK